MRKSSVLVAAMAFGVSASTGAAAATIAVPNGSFEQPSTGSYVYNPIVADVAFNGLSGVQRNGSAWGFADAPDGSQTAFIQSGFSGIGQISFSLSNLVIGQMYNVGFQASARPGYANNAFTVALNGATLGGYNVADNFWQAFSTNSFVASGTSALLSFTGSPTTNGDNDVGLDAVTITSAAPEPATWLTMILGFGVIGLALRASRKRKTAFTFA